MGHPPYSHFFRDLAVPDIKLTPPPLETEQIGMIHLFLSPIGEGIEEPVKKIVLLLEETVAKELGMNKMDAHGILSRETGPECQTGRKDKDTAGRLDENADKKNPVERSFL